jgi:hypothetical protein
MNEIRARIRSDLRGPIRQLHMLSGRVAGDHLPGANEPLCSERFSPSFAVSICVIDARLACTAVS